MPRVKRVRPFVPHIEDDDVIVVRITRGTPAHKKDNVLEKVRIMAKQLQKDQSFWDFL